MTCKNLLQFFEFVKKHRLPAKVKNKNNTNSHWGGGTIRSLRSCSAIVSLKQKQKNTGHSTRKNGNYKKKHKLNVASIVLKHNMINPIWRLLCQHVSTGRSFYRYTERDFCTLNSWVQMYLQPCHDPAPPHPHSQLDRLLFDSPSNVMPTYKPGFPWQPIEILRLHYKLGGDGQPQGSIRYVDCESQQ